MLTDSFFGTRNRALAVSALFLVFALIMSCSKGPSYPEAPRKGQEIVVDVRSLSPEVPQYFTFQYNGRNINFFVIRSGEKVLSFLDACTSCYPQKKGVAFDKGHFVCRACNVRYSVSEIETGIGGCFPIRISGERREMKYFIPVSTLEAAADKF